MMPSPRVPGGRSPNTLIIGINHHARCSELENSERSIYLLALLHEKDIDPIMPCIVGL